MRKLLLVVVLALVMACGGCSGLQGFNASVAGKVQTSLAQAKAGLEYLQASYVRLHAAGALPGLSDLSQDIANLSAVITKGDLVAALTLYQTARDRLSAIVAAMGA